MSNAPGEAPPGPDDADRESAPGDTLSEDATRGLFRRRSVELESSTAFRSDSGEARGAADPPPEQVGPYRIVESLGEGGMGSVWLGRQDQPVRREVAIKLIRRGWDSPKAVERFVSEQQALAVMNHPGIARVFEVGSTEGDRPYFAMELVDGAPITTYCDDRRGSIRERIALFVQVCEAVQHAHQKAIIHRDLKPSNVLVTEVDGVACPKVIDFGIAKALDAQLLQRKLFTEEGTVVGTPEYMSPEQADYSPEKIDTRTDIYSLGVMLYELIVGARPFDSQELRQGGYLGLQKVLLERDAPTPRRRLEQLGETAAREAARTRGCEPAAQLRSLDGDLTWIVGKALEKDPQRRYASASELAEDLRRHLRHETVLAGPPSVAYRIRKFVRRHRAAVSASLILVLLASGGLAFHRWREYALAIERSRDFENRAREKAGRFLGLRKRLVELDERRETAIRKLEDWQPPWERREELEIRASVLHTEREISELYTQTVSALSQALEEAPAGSAQRQGVRRTHEAILWQIYNDTRVHGAVELSPRFFKLRIDSLGLGTYARALAGVLHLRSEPPGARVYCFRYEERDARLLPLPFDPRRGLDEPEKGLLDARGLVVEKNWDLSRSPFRPGDRIVTVDSRPVRTRSDLAAALSGDEDSWRNRRIEVEVLRDDASRTVSWTPFPPASDPGEETPEGETPLRPGRVIDIYQQFGFTLEGYPLRFSEHSYLGMTDSSGALDIELPMGSYLLVLRLDGHDDVRYPVVVPSEESELTVAIPPRERIPEGYIYVPRGPVEYGGDPGAYEPLERGRAMVEGFFIARHEATFGEWLEFVNAPQIGPRIDRKTGSAPPRLDWSSAALRALAPPPKAGIATIQWIPFSELNGDLLFRWDETAARWTLGKSIDPSWPLRGVSMLAGLEFAHWKTQQSGGRWRFRLPTDLEWEKAARGVDRRPFVWGNYLLWTFCHSDFGDYVGRRPRPVGAYSTDESVYGVRDMAGSMKEPIPQRALPDYGLIVLRGGEWETIDRRDFHAASRNRRFPWLVFDFVGLRFAADFVKNP